VSAPILVTGGTGFLGVPLVRECVRRGREVHVLARVGSDRSPLEGLEVIWHTGDLCEPPAVERAVRAASTSERADVVHAAALISYRREDAERSRQVNVEGTRIVLDAARTVGVRRFLLVSSVVAVGHAPGPDALLDEDAPFNGAGLADPYVTTKRAAEDFALAVQRQLDVVVVNPGAIFGPSERMTNTIRFLSRLAAGSLGPFAPPGSLGVVGVDDVVAGCLAALERGRRGSRYLLVESNWSLLELFRMAAAELGGRPPRWRIPSPLWRPVVAGASLVDRLRPLRLATPSTLRLLGAHFRFDATRARTELDWRPRPFSEILRETVAGARSRGFLGAPEVPPGVGSQGKALARE